MTTVCMTNWDKWQSYRNDRGAPPWIKVHRNLMTNPEWAILTDAEKGQLVSMWIVAADKNGEIPAEPKIIRKICQLDDDPNINKFIELGFMASTGSQHDANMTPNGCQRDAPDQIRGDQIRSEEIRGEERRSEGAAAPVVELDGLNADAWSEYEAYRRTAKLRKLKPSSVRQQQRWLIEQGDERIQADIINRTIRNGWQGLFELKQGGNVNLQSRPRVNPRALESM